MERLSAFVGCVAGCIADSAEDDSHTHTHAAQFLICASCGQVAELDDPAIGAALHKGATARGFTVRRQTVEVEGLCPDCQKDVRST